jgi:UDP-N-acetylglucosamine transferase subunit ALG13
VTDACPESLRALAEAARARPLVFVTVGSDHHRFDRLVGWMDRWAAERDVDCVIQYGTAAPPASSHAVAYLDKPLLELLLDTADIAVAQGGPMSIVEARRHGRLPIVVPREPHLREVVDGHQVVFCRKLAQQGLIQCAEDEATLRRYLDAALDDPGAMLVEEDLAAAERAAAAVDRFSRAADDLAGQARGDLSERPRVLLLGGAGRSGSTLVERMLGTSTGVLELGETLHLWERGLRDDELCGCGLAFSECPFWTKVGEVAFGGWAQVDGAEMSALRGQVVRSRHTLGLLGFPARTGWRLGRDRLVRTVTSLYRAAAEVGDADVLVDSSKHPAYAMLLRRAPVDLRCVLVVRDPRAVAHSWSRSVVRPEVLDGSSEMPRYSVIRTALVWQFYSALYAGLKAAGVPVMVVRYEDLVSDPRATLGSVLEFGGLHADAVGDAVTSESVDLETGHTVAGNPMRFRLGATPIRRDDRWRTEMRPGDQRRVRLLTVPLRWLHGYR